MRKKKKIGLLAAIIKGITTEPSKYRRKAIRKAKQQRQKRQENMRLNKGDTLTVDSLDCISKKRGEFFALIKQIQEKGIVLISKKEDIDTSTDIGRLKLNAFVMMVELEYRQKLEARRERMKI